MDVVQVGVAAARLAGEAPSGGQAALTGDRGGGRPHPGRGARAGGGAGLLVEDAHVPRAVDAGEVDDPPSPQPPTLRRRRRRARRAEDRAARAQLVQQLAPERPVAGGPVVGQVRVVPQQGRPSPVGAHALEHRQRPVASACGVQAQVGVEGGVHHGERKEPQARRALLADQVGAIGAGDPRGESGGLAEPEARVVLGAGRLEPADGLVVAEAQVVEADALDRPDLGPQPRELGREGRAGLGRGERGVQAHLAARRPHRRGQGGSLALVGPTRRAVEGVGVAPDEEDRRADAAQPGGLQQVGDVVPWVRPGERARDPRRPPPARDAGQALGRAPADPVDVVGQGHAPPAGRGDRQRPPQGGDVALDRGLLQVEPGDPAERARGQRQPVEAVPVDHAQLVPARQEVEGARHQVARDLPLRVARREQQGEAPGAVRGGGREGVIPLEERLRGVVGGDPDALVRGPGRVHEVGGAVRPARRRRPAPRRSSRAPSGHAERRARGRPRSGSADQPRRPIERR